MSGGTEDTPAPAGRGRRLHPLTPWRRAWAPLAGAFAVVVQNPDEAGRWLGGIAVGWLLLATAAGLLLAGLYGYLSWRATRYLVTDTELRIRTGLLFRRSAHLRLDRIQAVDVSRPLLARALGVAKLRMDVVGSRSADELAYLGETEARALRAELLARAAGIAPEAAPTAGEAPAHVLHQVDPGTLAWSLVLRGRTWAALLPAAALTPVVWLTTESPVAGLLVLLPLLAAGWRAGVGSYLTLYGWTVSESPDGLRLDHGLLQRDHATVPPGRVQCVRVIEPLLWRPRAWTRVELEVAGTGAEGGGHGGLLLPVATRDAAVALLARILPEVDIAATLAAVEPVPRRARWAAPVWRTGYGYAATGAVFVTRRGRLRRVHELVPHAKVQSVRLTQGPRARLLRLADVRVDHGANGTVSARLLDAERAAHEVAAQAERSRIGRRTAPPERWLTGT
ncbi:PH domain-containing protein [Streptomyces sp. RFCAC02]|uniref:PH domain-containing protein n=1 Tax=Streptomyces sp. RFCAC02 TaxID=2499143 RepID=UPI00101F8FDD|nr:PH domain-containing protein [Streptomyces sp. RFCAC02]